MVGPSASSSEGHAFGSWPSPISAALVAAGGVSLNGIAVANDGAFWWSELRPAEAGRSVLVRLEPGRSSEDVIDAPYSARTRVHEYGGGAWFLGADTAYFSNWDDQRLHRLEVGAHGGEPTAITPEPEEPHGWRFADGRESPDGAWIVCVSEDHHAAVVADHGEALNALVAVPAGGGEPTVLSDRTDFVAAPRFSPDGRWLSWICWDHPDMPWDGTRLLAAPVWSSERELRLGNVKVVAGGDRREAIHGADWTADGRLVFSTDRSGFWNLQSWRPGDEADQALTDLEGSEIGAPQWVFGIQRWVELDSGDLVVVITENAVDRLALLDASGQLQPISTPFVAISALAASGRAVAVVGHSTTVLPQIAEITLDEDAGGERSVEMVGRSAVIRPPADLGVDPAWFSEAEAIEFPVGDRTSHAFFYPPTGPAASADAGSVAQAAAKPPLVVIGHGGPTTHSSPDLSLKVQYWTSRGIGVVDVNYGGSTGYGKAYRELLNGAWGVVDVEDCIGAARHLVATGRVDPQRVAIRGGSAGGLTVLRALQTTEVFTAGTSLYGVADLSALAADTHKFESRYLDGMIGPFPEAKSVYEERSPINHTEDLSCPLLVMQGSEDEVVPPSQSEAIVAAVASKGVPHAYLLFPGEQHGFRQADTIVRSLEAELWFYGRVFGFEPADAIDPVREAVGL